MVTLTGDLILLASRDNRYVRPIDNGCSVFGTQTFLLEGPIGNSQS